MLFVSCASIRQQETEVRFDPALFDALHRGDLEKARYLAYPVSWGWGVSRDEFDQTPLMIAAWRGYTDIAKELIDAGSDVNAKKPNGDTALMWVADHADVVRMLLDAGAQE